MTWDDLKSVMCKFNISFTNDDINYAIDNNNINVLAVIICHSEKDFNDYVIDSFIETILARVHKNNGLDLIESQVNQTIIDMLVESRKHIDKGGIFGEFFRFIITFLPQNPNSDYDLIKYFIDNKISPLNDDTRHDGQFLSQLMNNRLKNIIAKLNGRLFYTLRGGFVCEIIKCIDQIIFNTSS